MQFECELFPFPKNLAVRLTFSVFITHFTYITDSSAEIVLTQDDENFRVQKCGSKNLMLRSDFFMTNGI